MRVIATGGCVTKKDDKLSITNADDVLILLAMGTTYNGNDPYEGCRLQVMSALSKEYNSMYETHVKDYQNLFNRVLLELGDTDNSNIPTDLRLQAIKEGQLDNQLTALMFQYGRYLLISSSRENGPLPAHLQGVWNDNVACRISWTCDFHLDINTQMNYWPAEVTNLSECTVPLFKWIEEKLIPSGRQTAKELYNAAGWVAHIFSNPWGYTSSGWGECWSLHVTGGAWIATHYWEHYCYAKDRDFLEQRVYGIYKELVTFFLDYLTIDPESGYLLSGPSISPESFFKVEEEPYAVSMGSTTDTVVIREIFNHYINIVELLGKEDEIITKVKEAVQKLPPYKIGKHGQLQEWFYDFEEVDRHHRHTSHLLGLYPFNQITPERTPGLATAAKVAINRRSTPKEKWEDTGWARSMLLLYEARLRDGECAYEHLLSMEKTITNDNLMVFHPPTAGALTNVYELDGNTGFCAGVAEMLLQSHHDEIQLLPALPKEWSKGKITGLCARGGFELDIHWDNEELVKATISSKFDQSCMLKYGNYKIDFIVQKGKKYELNNELKICN